MKDRSPVIGITMGDPLGIGPEIIIKALSNPAVVKPYRVIAIANAAVMQRAVEITGRSLAIRKIGNPTDALFSHGTLDVLDRREEELMHLPLGSIQREAGLSAYNAITDSICLAMDKTIDAVVTAPIHKEALALTGCGFAGHTEIFTALTGAKKTAMMLVSGRLRVAHISTHVSLADSCKKVTKERVFDVIILLRDELARQGIKKPRIGIASLNPHGGESGLFGNEEIMHIIPAVKSAQELDILAEGPYPSDTIFQRAAAGAHDGVIAMYHDQGHIPVKMAGFKYSKKNGAWSDVRGINVTLGLPIIRVSVDHGTAFELAGKGTASEHSLTEALEWAVISARGGGV